MKPSTLILLRRWHLYVGVFLSPAILFFAFTGFVQVVGLQDRRDPPPPAWVSWAAGIHQHQAAPKPKPPKPTEATIAPRAEKHDDDHDAEAFVPLKVFALLTALGLFVTTLIGLTVALGTRATRRKALIALTAGVVVPIVLTLV